MMRQPHLNDELMAVRYRERLIDRAGKKVLIARLTDSNEGGDKYTAINCSGFGRLREFRDYKLYLERVVFPERTLRANFRGHPPQDVLVTQVFQIAACNWRCWYCFVDDNRLSADRRTSRYLSATELIDYYLAEPNHSNILDLSGGQPDLVPEWTLWMIEECDRRGILDDTYVWIDDNLSNDFLFQHLSSHDIGRIAATPNLSRMGCFKGYDEASFSFTTLAEPGRFYAQFDIAKRILEAGFRFYAYATFTGSDDARLEEKMRRFVDRLQSINELLPLWTTPLKIHEFAVTKERLNEERRRSLSHQLLAFAAWDEELRRRFPPSILLLRPDQVC